MIRTKNKETKFELKNKLYVQKIENIAFLNQKFSRGLLTHFEPF